MSMADYKGVWVFAEQREGELQKVSLELLGEGRKIADKLGVKLTALLLGENVKSLADTLGKHGADEVLVAENSLLKHYTTDGYTKVICDLANDRKPGISANLITKSSAGASAAAPPAVRTSQARL